MMTVWQGNRTTRSSNGSALMRRRKRILVSVVLMLGLVWLFYGAYRSFTDIEHGEHWKTVKWLPSEATDISFYRSYSFTAYEFDISEKGFLQWASRWEISPITTSFTIRRYSSQLDSTRYPQLNNDHTEAEYNQWLQAQSERKAKAEATIDEGYFYAHRQSNGGGVWVAYDKKRGRAYYKSMPR